MTEEKKNDWTAVGWNINRTCANRIDRCNVVGTCDNNNNNRQSREIATENRTLSCIISGVTSHLHCRFHDRCVATLPSVDSTTARETQTRENNYQSRKAFGQERSITFYILGTEWFVQAHLLRFRVWTWNTFFFFLYLVRGLRNN